MNIDSLPEWLGAALIAAVFGLLGFFGRKLLDILEERRKRKRKAIQQLEKLERTLDEAKSVFENQNYLARRLMLLLQSQYADQIPAEVGYDETFYQLYDFMEDEQRELFDLIRGTTINSMHRLNEELSRWASKNSARQLAGKSSPEVDQLDTQLDQLRKHLNGWFDKYEAVFKTSERRSLVYMADEKQHGLGFPGGLGQALNALLVKLRGNTE